MQLFSGLVSMLSDMLEAKHLFVASSSTQLLSNDLVKGRSHFLDFI